MRTVQLIETFRDMNKGDVLTVTDQCAEAWIERGIAREYVDKSMHNRPRKTKAVKRDVSANQS